MRRALEEDVDGIEGLEVVLFPGNCLNAYSLRNELKQGADCWVIERDGRLVAYLLARVTNGLVDILRVGVLEGYRRAGFGFRLVSKAVGLAPEAMLTVAKDNRAALELYWTLGFEIAGEIDDNWVMVRTSCR